MKLIAFFVAAILAFQLSSTSFAQEPEALESIEPAATQSATPSSQFRPQFGGIQRDDITKPEEEAEREQILAFFSQRRVENLDFLNFMAYAVQSSVKIGVPANTVILILLLPLLATIVAFIRHILGLPSMEMLVPVTLSVTLIATGLTAGFILLITIILASLCSRFILKKIRIMQLPKMALSMFVVAVFVFGALTACALFGILQVKQLSIFPVLLFILLSDKIVALQFERSFRETFSIILVTIILGILGYLLLSSSYLQNFILLYPEVILLLIPINILIGRYFGLRFTEYFRFSSLKNGNQ